MTHAVFHRALAAPASRSPLLASLVEQMRLRHYSVRTIDSYLSWVIRYIKFHQKRHPRELGRDHVEEYLSSLAIESNVSASTQNQALAAIGFLYRDVLNLPLEDSEALARAKRPVRLPVVLTREEVRRLIGEMEGTPQLVAMLLYGAGMRGARMPRATRQGYRLQRAADSDSWWQGQ